MRTAIVCLLLALLAIPALAGDLTGKWTGQVEFKTPDGQDQTRPVVFDLKQNGGDVTGAAGYEENDMLPIEKGKVEAKKFTFVVTAPDGEYKVALNIASDSKLEGTVSFTPQGGTEVIAKLAVSKAAAAK